MKICLQTRKIKNPNYLSAFEEYRKRLSREVKFVDRLQPDYSISISRYGEAIDSVEFARRLQDLALQGKSRLMFYVDEPNPDAEMQLNLIDCDIDPQLLPVLLIEQIYRAFRILGGSNYHK
ncbi:MAG: 23S rRNA (pseudouridine(1915)-N(3))-methyltransferase RlmH [Bacillota bacterium]|nr:23S rRNA (pseudouridine(1915)-N(3))-methyltransferase RlmH [Bacillota bacterium]